jgi:hypothetical protein
MAAANSDHFIVQGSGTKEYRVTVNYDTGHWCECRGMISMKSKYQEDAGRTAGTSCKHVKGIIKDKFNDDWGTKITGAGGPRTPAAAAPPPAPTKPTGRRAAILATRAKQEARRLAEIQSQSEGSSLTDRIAALEAARG